MISEHDPRYWEAIRAFHAKCNGLPLLSVLNADQWRVELVNGHPEVVPDEGALEALGRRGRFAAPLPPTVAPLGRQRPT